VRSLTIRRPAISFGLVSKTLSSFKGDEMTTNTENSLFENDFTGGDTIEDLERKLAQDPDSANLHYNLGLALVRAKQWDRATVEFRSSMKLKPGLLEARVNIAGILLQKGDYDGCIEESL